MSTLNFLFISIIFVVGFQEILSMWVNRDDYKYTEGVGAHKFHTEARDWNDARKTCIKEGGHLAIINSDAEENVLKDLFQQAGPITGTSETHLAFIGIHDQFLEGDWTTVLDEPLGDTGFTKWSANWGGQPDNGYGNHNCGALVKEGSMDDTSCFYLRPFFCELPVSGTVKFPRRSFQ